MTLTRREMLRFLSAGATVTAAGLVLPQMLLPPEPEPVRRWWQVPRGEGAGIEVSLVVYGLSVDGTRFEMEDAAVVCQDEGFLIKATVPLGQSFRFSWVEIDEATR